MSVGHMDMLVHVVTKELEKLPEYVQQDVLSSEEKFIGFLNHSGFSVGFSAGTYYGVRGGAELIGHYFDRPDTEIDTTIELADILIDSFRSIAGF